MFIISKYIAECSLYCKHKRVEQLLLNRSKLVSNRIVPTNKSFDSRDRESCFVYLLKHSISSKVKTKRTKYYTKTN